ncbi:putative sec1-like protein [Helianthus anomalus]
MTRELYVLLLCSLVFIFFIHCTGLLYEMIRSAKRPGSKSNWKVLIMDKVTLKIMSHSCKMAELTEEGVSLPEDINKRRQPLPEMDAVYFIQPTKENVVILLSDMAGKTPLYREYVNNQIYIFFMLQLIIFLLGFRAYIFFSSTVPKELVAYIKREPTIRSRFRAMKEGRLQMNLEYTVIDSQCFITDHGKALEDLYGDKGIYQKGDDCLTAMANQIATVFASMSEFPLVRYRAAKSLDHTTMTTFSDLIPTKLAAAVWNILMKYKTTLGNFPQIETCELLIVDRSIDQIAPIIHEWTYDAMCHDLLEMDGNKYVHEVPIESGGFERKEVFLDVEHDPVWLELRHSHIADASDRLHDKITNFLSKNKAAQMHQGSRDGDVLSTRELQKLVQALPQYSEQKEKLSVHADIAAKIHSIRRKTGLNNVGKLEQDLVFGDAGTKDVINFLKEQMDIPQEYKVRLLMIYAATRPEKFESDKLTKLMELANLSRDDMNAVYNMRFLEAAPETKTTGALSVKLHLKKKKHGLRKDRPGEESALRLSRFHPMIEELIEKLSKNELPMNEYPCMNDPSPPSHGASDSGSARVHDNTPGRSMRSRPSTWARPRSSDDSDPVLSHTTREFKKMGKRIFVFIVGGATRSELRVCHHLTTKLRREIVLGSSSLDDPAQYVEKVKLLTPNDNEISLDALELLRLDISSL